MSRVLDVLFPMSCASCGEGEWPFCGACRSGLVPIIAPMCDRCGSPFASESEDCPGCPPLDQARSAFVYEGPARAAVHRLKFAGNRSIARALGSAMAAAAGSAAAGAHDAVTWVPLSRARLAERGYDQARALAKVVSRELDLPLRTLLRRVRDVSPQAKRGRDDRRRAMLGAFAATGDVPADILLIDDVLTTGATVGECAEALKRAGASRVEVLTAARAVRGRRTGRCYPPQGFSPGLWLPGGDLPPVVDASRGRNDPRKVTHGR